MKRILFITGLLLLMFTQIASSMGEPVAIYDIQIKNIGIKNFLIRFDDFTKLNNIDGVQMNSTARYLIDKVINNKLTNSDISRFNNEILTIQFRKQVFRSGGFDGSTYSELNKLKDQTDPQYEFFNFDFRYVGKDVFIDNISASHIFINFINELGTKHRYEVIATKK